MPISRRLGSAAPLLGALAWLLAVNASQAQETGDRIARVAALEGRLTSLEQEIQQLEDTQAIKRLQRAYGYYLDKRLSGEIAELFSRDPSTSVEYGNAGVYLGRERIAEYLQRLIGTGPREGSLFNHIVEQGIVHVAPDGLSARGRWRALIQTGEHGESAVWAEGPYENEYVKEDGVWKFSKIHWFQTLAAPYAPGWHLEQLPMGGIDEDFPPDLPPTVEYESYPGTYLPPFHYANPVSGRCEEGVCDAQ